VLLCGLRGRVRLPAAERIALAVRAGTGRVALVAGDADDHGVARRTQDRSGSHDVRAEGPGGILECRAHDRLRGEGEGGLGARCRTRDRVGVAYVPADVRAELSDTGELEQ